MDLIPTRELARIQSALHLLRRQRAELSELSDIQAFRGLEESFREALQESCARGIVPVDPVAVVRADWQRLAAWSNRIQLALLAADQLGEELDSPAVTATEEHGRKGKVSEDRKLNAAGLQGLKSSLDQAPATLNRAMEQGRNEVWAQDWDGDYPYTELTEVAEAMEWEETLDLAETPGPWAQGVALRARPLVASRFAVQVESAMTVLRLKAFQTRAEHADRLLRQHQHHGATLAEVKNLIAAGQVVVAATAFQQLEPIFQDLDYRAVECELDGAKMQFKEKLQAVRRLAEVGEDLLSLSREAGGFFGVPPFGLLKRCAVAIQAAETARADAEMKRVSGRDIEQDRTLAEVTATLTRQLEEFRSGAVVRVRRWAWMVSMVWLAVTFAVPAGFQYQQVAQAREIAAMLGVRFPVVAGAPGRLGTIAVRWIPAGCFMMGSPSTEEGRSSEEIQHEVALSRGFFLAETECTQGQWAEVMGNNPSHFKGEDRPLEQVSWDEAAEYCRKLTERQRRAGLLPEGWAWRLPTEAEWEYAARAGTMEPRHGELDAIAWHDGNSGGQSHAVKGKRANAWGLHDMIGNVWEWSSDGHWDYPSGTATDPTGPSSSSYRIFRGGGWGGVDRFCRSARRGKEAPGARYDYLGFRPAFSSIP